MPKDLSYSDQLRSFAPFFIWRKTSFSQTILGLAVTASHSWLSPPCQQSSGCHWPARQAVTSPDLLLENTGIFNRKVVSSIHEECDPTHLVRHQCTGKKQLFPLGKDCPFRQKKLCSTHALLTAQAKFICIISSRKISRNLFLAKKHAWFKTKTREHRCPHPKT